MFQKNLNSNYEYFKSNVFKIFNIKISKIKCKSIITITKNLAKHINKIDLYN